MPTAASANFGDVLAAYNTCVNGDTLFIPVGEATWGATDLLTVTKAIRIVGAGMDETQATPRAAFATIIHVTNSKAITTTYPSGSAASSCITGISHIVWEITASVSNQYLLSFGGKSYMTLDGAGAVKSGLRVDHNRFRCSADNDSATTISSSSNGQVLPQGTINVTSTTGFLPTNSYFFVQVGAVSNRITYTAKTATTFTGCVGGTGTLLTGQAVTQSYPLAAGAQIVTWSAFSGSTDSYLTGAFYHNFYDYPVGAGGSEVNNFACAGSPNGADPHAWGQYIWSNSYTWGDPDLNVIYIEDNIFHRAGADLGTLGGGGRFILRHNTSWGGLQGHGLETGNNMGAVGWEWHNNWIDSTNNDQAFAGFTDRGGPAVVFNNRFTGYDIGGNAQPSIRFELDRTTGTNSGVVGSATGRNFFDKNCRGHISANGVSGGFDPVTTQQITGDPGTPVDTRIGSVYAQGTGCSISSRTYTLSGLSNKGIVDAWKNFVLINVDTSGPELSGDQGVTTGATLGCYGLIESSTMDSPDAKVTISTRNAAAFNLTTGGNWEIRRVEQYFCIPGAGKLPLLLNSGDNINNTPNTGIADTTGCAFLSANSNGKHKYWAGQAAIGSYQWNNLARALSSTAWNAGSPNVLAPSWDGNEIVAGGSYDTFPTFCNNDGTGSTPYPTAPNTATNLRVGAHWNAPGYTEGLNSTDVGAPTQAYGSTYPNPFEVNNSMPLRPLGIFTLGSTSSTCPDAGTTCKDFSVNTSALDGAPNMTGSFQLVPQTGTLQAVDVFFSWDTGGTYWSGNGYPGTGVNATFFSALKAAGHMLIFVKMNTWFKSTVGQSLGALALACRPATVIQYLKDTYPAPQFNIIGTSSGSSVVAFVLSSYQVSGITKAIIDSGPPFSYLKKGCEGSAYPDYDFAASAGGSAVTYIDYPFGYNDLSTPKGPCYNQDTGFEATWDVSGCESGFLFNYPGVDVHFIKGTLDQLLITNRATDYYNLLVANGHPATMHTITGMGHGMMGNSAGLAVAQSILLASVSGKIISLSGSGLSFGNIIVNASATGTLHVSNTGTNTITVNNISYPAHFNGATAGFQVTAGQTVNVTVTFTPTAATPYSGNITVNSDATVTAATIAVDGAGVNPTGGTGHGRGRLGRRND